VVERASGDAAGSSDLQSDRNYWQASGLCRFDTLSRNVQISQTGVTFVVAGRRRRIRIELELKMIFNFIFGRHKSDSKAGAQALSDLKVGESAVLSELEVSPPIAEHLMNLGFVPGLVVKVLRSGPGGDPRVYRVDGTEVAMRRDLSRHIHVELLGAPAFGD
jgi:ferrous iron transport protein A